MSLKHLKECLVCGNTDLKVYCDLGEMPLVNNLKNSPNQEDIKYPLVVMECSCTHKQLSVAVDRALLFKDYLYQTGASQEHKDFFHLISLDIYHSFGIDSKKNILDIGCNDGSLLVEFQFQGWEIKGVEPSNKFKEELELNGIPYIKDFFPTNRIKEKFNLITAFNVFAHNDDPKTFLIEASKLLKENGRIYILTTPARIDNYYHEHISYFTPQSMMILANKCGAEVVSFKTVTMHGESFLFELAHHKERTIDTPCLNGNIVAYGASASETVLFNLYKIKPEYVVDDNPLKQGKFLPGVGSPVVSADHLAKDQRDLNIIVCHNLANEITEKIKKLRPKNKDKFITLI